MGSLDGAAEVRLELGGALCARGPHEVQQCLRRREVREVEGRASTMRLLRRRWRGRGRLERWGRPGLRGRRRRVVRGSMVGRSVVRGRHPGVGVAVVVSAPDAAVVAEAEAPTGETGDVGGRRDGHGVAARALAARSREGRGARGLERERVLEPSKQARGRGAIAGAEAEPGQDRKENRFGSCATCFDIEVDSVDA